MSFYIPEKILVGYQKRTGTYTGQLAYVVYKEKNKIKAETSWQNWRDQKIQTIELDNVPTRFVLNKGVQRNGSFGSYGGGRSMIRIYDERGVEFEINVDNLIGILMHSDVSKRDIMEPCVYAWSGRNLVLLPINSQEYQEAIEFTQKQSKRVKVSELTPGATLQEKKSKNQVIYLGKFPYYLADKYSFTQHEQGLCHVVYNPNHQKHEPPYYVLDPNRYSNIISNEPPEDYAYLIENFQKTLYGSKIKHIAVEQEKNEEKQKKFFFEKGNDIFYVDTSSYGNNSYCYRDYEGKIVNPGIVVFKLDKEKRSFPSISNTVMSKEDIEKKNKIIPYLVLENGTKMKIEREQHYFKTTICTDIELELKTKITFDK